MKRNIIKIDENKCNGCGICIDACHEGALKLIDGKAKLISESYCDGLGACLPDCPAGAIEIEEREAVSFDEEAVKQNKEQQIKSSVKNVQHHENLACGCPGTHVKNIERKNISTQITNSHAAPTMMESQLRQWPVQLKLVPTNAPYFENANLLVAADCTAYSYANFHQDFIKNKVTIIGCPKLDMVDYTDKLTEIFKLNQIKSVKVVRMEVPCCGGIVSAVKNALINSGKMIPWQIVTIGTDGNILE